MGRSGWPPASGRWWGWRWAAGAAGQRPPAEGHRRRPRRRRRARCPVHGAWAHAELSGAEALLDRDPRSAASTAAATLRRYLDRRYGTDIQAATTAELDEGEPYWFLGSRWRGLLSILHALDAERFPRSRPGSEDTERIRAALANAHQFVAESAAAEEKR